MYVCLCHGVTEDRIRIAVRQGAASVRDLTMATGCGSQCGSCVPLARQLITETLERSDEWSELRSFSAISAA